ncbi:MAG: tRNA 4-thiouridine(8) synthase ThiI [Promethearchaeota archaeon]
MDQDESIKKGKIIGLGLVSGGLDSLTACLLLQQQDIEVIGLNFKSPFCLCDKVLSHSDCGLNLFPEKLGIKIHTLIKGDDYLEIIRNPKFGYGKNLNPCIDCRIYILKKAKEFQKEINADFIFTGEVLNQRPKSQHFKALKIVERESGLERRLLRPLSALQLEPTIYEEKGLVDRTKLLGITGRSRKIQLELARKHGLLDEYFACGGCLLTDINFSNRMRDYLKFNQTLKMGDINILKQGRHFRFKKTKIIVGRNEVENKILLQLKNSDDIIMEVKEIPSPITIVQGDFNEESLEYAALLTLRYSDLKGSKGKVIYGKKYENLNKSIILEVKNPENLIKYML